MHSYSLPEFDALTEQEQEALWSQLRTDHDDVNNGAWWLDRWQGGPEPSVPKPGCGYRLDHPPVPKPERKRLWAPSAVHLGIDLEDIPTETYVYVLAGLEGQARRRRVACPFPEHEDDHPSFAIYETAFNCFGCNRGGRIWDFAALLWGYNVPVRGDSFREVRARLLELFR